MGPPRQLVRDEYAAGKSLIERSGWPSLAFRSLSLDMLIAVFSFHSLIVTLVIGA